MLRQHEGDEEHGVFSLTGHLVTEAYVVVDFGRVPAFGKLLAEALCRGELGSRLDVTRAHAIAQLEPAHRVVGRRRMRQVREFRIATPYPSFVLLPVPQSRLRSHE
jgi:hypothetical protein